MQTHLKLKLNHMNRFSGIVNNDLDFNYRSNVSPKQGCGVTLHGQFWYLGGNEFQYKRQVSPKE